MLDIPDSHKWYQRSVSDTERITKLILGRDSGVASRSTNPCVTFIRRLILLY